MFHAILDGERAFFCFAKDEDTYRICYALLEDLKKNSSLSMNKNKMSKLMHEKLTFVQKIFV